MSISNLLVPNDYSLYINNAADNSFYVYPATNQSIPNNAATTLTFVNASPTNPYSTGSGALVASSGIWTAPVAGTYIFSASCSFAAAIGTFSLSLSTGTYVLASEFVATTTSNAIALSVSAIVGLNAGATVFCTVNQGTGSAINCTAIYFSGTRSGNK